MDKLQLQKMQGVDITQADRSKLANLCDIHIDASLPAAGKMQSYFDQIVNPYCFLYEDTPVRIRFVTQDKTLKQSLYSYFLNQR